MFKFKNKNINNFIFILVIILLLLIFYLIIFSNNIEGLNARKPIDPCKYDGELNNECPNYNPELSILLPKIEKFNIKMKNLNDLFKTAYENLGINNKIFINNKYKKNNKPDTPYIIINIENTFRSDQKDLLKDFNEYDKQIEKIKESGIYTHKYLKGEKYLNKYRYVPAGNNIANFGQVDLLNNTEFNLKRIDQVFDKVNKKDYESKIN